MPAPTTHLQLSDIATPLPGDGFRAHATAVVLDGQAALLLGPSGAGKSRTALELLAHGAELIADDAVEIRAEGGAIMAQAPDGARGLIEARAVGLLPVPLASGAWPLALAVELGRAEPDRLPQSRKLHGPGASVPLILGAGHPNLAAVILHILRHGPPR